MIPIKQTAVLQDGRKIELTAYAFRPSVSLTGLPLSKVREVLKAAWEHAGEFWHRVILKKHFTHAGAKEYGYKPRKQAEVRTSMTKSGKIRVRKLPSYDQRKFRKWGHTYPLVWSGEMKRQVMRTRDVRSTAKGAKVVLHGPKHLWQFRKDYGQADKAAELSRISEADARLITRVLDRAIERGLGRPRGQQGSATAVGAGHRTGA